jgi:hypothetical protein
MLHLSSWMTTLPMMLIGMTGILLVIGFFHRRRRRCFCRIHPRASCRVVWKYSLGVMPYSFLKARKRRGKSGCNRQSRWSCTPR